MFRNAFRFSVATGTTRCFPNRRLRCWSYVVENFYVEIILRFSRETKNIFRERGQRYGAPLKEVKSRDFFGRIFFISLSRFIFSPQ